MKRRLFVPGAILLLAFTIVSCKDGKLQNASQGQPISSNLASELRVKTGLNLPPATKLILATNSTRGDCDIWLFEIDASDPVQLPGQSVVLDAGDDRKNAELLERMGGISIGAPKACYFDIWQVSSNVQGQATLIVTSNRQYVMLKRFY